MPWINRVIGVVAVVGVGLIASGCEGADSRLKSLTVGIPKDSTLKVMGSEKPDRLDAYLYKGQYIETMYYSKPGKADPEAKQDRNMSPVVLLNGKLVGWGWKFWDSVATANNIQVAAKK